MNNHTCIIGVAWYSYGDMEIGTRLIRDDPKDSVGQDVANPPGHGIMLDWNWFKFCPECGAPQPVADRMKPP